MSNPNSLNQNPENSSAETGWESVAAEADKKNWSTEQNEPEHIDAEASHQSRQSFLGGLRQQLKDLAKPAESHNGPATKSTTLTPEQRATRHQELLRRRIQEFAKNVENPGQIYAVESMRVQSLERKLDRYSGKFEHSSSEKRQHEKDQREYMRYGASFEHDDSPTFRELKKAGLTYASYDDKDNYGRSRAADWKTVDLCLNGEHGREARKKLRERGYKKFPDKWNDDNFTSHEIHQMAGIVGNFLDLN